MISAISDIGVKCEGSRPQDAAGSVPEQKHPTRVSEAVYAVFVLAIGILFFATAI